MTDWDGNLAPEKYDTEASDEAAEEWDGNPEELSVSWSLPWDDVMALEKLFAQPGNEKFAHLIQAFEEARQEALADAEEELAYQRRRQANG